MEKLKPAQKRVKENEKIIGVISDTHLSYPENELKELFKPGGIFENIDILIHAGDFTSERIISYLSEKKRFKFFGVCGNMDRGNIRSRLPEKRTISISGHRIGITHGWGAPINLGKKIYHAFNDPEIDCIVFGHSHHPENQFLNKTLMFNPGAFKKDFYRTQKSIGKLFVSADKIRGEIIPLL